MKNVGFSEPLHRKEVKKLAADMKRIVVTIPPELEKGLDEIKRERFYNKPYSEVYRYIFSLGLKAAEAQKEVTENQRQEWAG